MLQIFKNHRYQELALFLLGFLLPLAFAIYTNHAWEDWYITYRASKNLAIGNGLVFMVGERVHSFTSPLGTLIPALFNFLTGNTSDDLVLWLYRIFNCVLLGLTSVILLRIARYLKLRNWSIITLLGMFMFDVKTVDFSINGMETAMMVFFLSLAIHLLLIPSKRPVLYLGLVWAALMWTRPDSFIYIIGLNLGFLLFPRSFPTSIGRVRIIQWYLRSTLVAALAYGPWLIWAWSYYGSFVPHTVTAKGLSGKRSITKLLGSVLRFPLRSLTNKSSLDWLFLPAYAHFGGWPAWIRGFSRIIGWVSSFAWVFPSITPTARAISFAALFANLYLTLGMPFAFPWYFPSAALFNIIAFALLLDRAISSLTRPGDRVESANRKQVLGRGLSMILRSAAGFTLLVILWLFISAGYQLRVQQTLIDNRKQVGLWLRENARSPKDRVFTEGLGYIGFFSNLKMYDYPGLSSPEVVAALRKLGDDGFGHYGKLIDYLRPEWLVLRPFEVENIQKSQPNLLDGVYKPAKVFDLSDKLKSYPSVRGRRYLELDQTYTIFRLQNRES